MGKCYLPWSILRNNKLSANTGDYQQGASRFTQFNLCEASCLEAQITTEGQKWGMEPTMGIGWSLYGEHFAPSQSSSLNSSYSKLLLHKEEEKLWGNPYSEVSGNVWRAGMRYRVKNGVVEGGATHCIVAAPARPPPLRKPVTRHLSPPPSPHP